MTLYTEGPTQEAIDSDTKFIRQQNVFISPKGQSINYGVRQINMEYASKDIFCHNLAWRE